MIALLRYVSFCTTFIAFTFLTVLPDNNTNIIDSDEIVRAPRTDAQLPTDPQAIAGNSCDLTKVLELLAIIRSRIGNVFQAPGRRTVLSTLGDPVELGPNLNIVRKLLLLQVDFSGVFTTLLDTKTTLTECCEDLHETITTCCAELSADISGIFTTLNNLNINVTATVDFGLVLTVLNDIRITLTDCCSDIANNFASTFTVLSDITATITDCCSDLKTTITTCCNDILNTLQASQACSQIGITQSLVNAGGGFFVISSPGNYSLKEDITALGGSPSNAIIEITASDVTLDLCGRSITGALGNATNGIVTSTGLSNITIKNGNIDAVDANGIKLYQGVTDFNFERITTTSCGCFGIALAGVALESISNGYIIQCQTINCGISDEGLSECSSRSGLVLSRTSRFTLNTLGGLLLSSCRNVIIEQSNFSSNLGSLDAAGAILAGSSNCSFLNCLFNDNQGVQNGSGVLLFLSNNNVFEECLFNANIGNRLLARFIIGFATGIQMELCTGNIFRNCQANGNNAVSAFGFVSSIGTQNSFLNCVASGNTAVGGGEASAFRFSGETSSTVRDCQALNTVATDTSGAALTAFSAGFKSEAGTDNIFENCIADKITGDDITAGFHLLGGINESVMNCRVEDSAAIANTGYGIFLDLNLTDPCIQCFIKNNSVSNTAGSSANFGYLDAASPASTSLFTGNFAFNNGTNYVVVYPSGALPTVTGSFSGGLPATGTSGTFDNISIDL